jgi:tetraprenyl-beta-curcumene synthase
LLWGLPAVAREVRAWEGRALAIPDASLRADALDSFARKRANTDGAALFSTLARRPDRKLLQIIVAYETIWDFLDNVSERGASMGEANGHQLHRALHEALDPDTSISDYYRHHLCGEDGDHLRVLVEICRECCALLPSYRSVKDLLIQEGRRSDVGAFNHQPDPARRTVGLTQWAHEVFPGEAKLSWSKDEPSWFELTAAASCSAVIHVLLTMASEPSCDELQIGEAYAGYFPWFSIAVTMLDSYVDQAEDAANGAHSYIAHYPSQEVAVRRVREAIERSTRSVSSLRQGHRHAVIAACMVAMYVSKDSARTPQMRATSASLVRAGGPLVRLLVPVLRLWRIAYGQESA